MPDADLKSYFEICVKVSFMEVAVVETVEDMLEENQQWNMQKMDFLILRHMLNGQEVVNICNIITIIRL